MTTRSGKCLCGAVTITARAAEDEFSACHCKMCRRWSGGPFMEIECGTDVSFDAAEDVAIYESSDWAERGFCSRCGTHLFYRFRKTGRYGVPVGLFDDEENLVFTYQVFIDEKPSSYAFSNETENLTGPELIARYRAL